MKLRSLIGHVWLATWVAAVPFGCGDDANEVEASSGSSGTETSTTGTSSTPESTNESEASSAASSESAGESSSSSGSAGETEETEGGTSSSSEDTGESSSTGEPIDVSEQIATVLGTPDGDGLELPIQGAIVTYVKPLLGNFDPAGFFLQADQAGPALFVAVDASTLAPAPAVGDEIELTVEAVATVDGVKQATAVSGVSVLSSGNPIAPLVADISEENDLVTNIDAYTSRIISITGTIEAEFQNAGQPNVAARFLTAGVDDPNLRLRLPGDLRQFLDLEVGCEVTIAAGPFWRFNNVAQPSVITANDLGPITCTPPTVEDAIPASPTSVLVYFTRTIDPASVLANGSQFTFTGGLTASAAVASENTVLITTSPQTIGAEYTVTVANTVEDTTGGGVGEPNTATFSGFVTTAVVRINELNANVNANNQPACDLIELRVISGGSMDGFNIRERNGGGGELNLTFANLVVATNDYVLVHVNSNNNTCNPGGSGNETVSPNELPTASFGANLDFAWDWYSTDTGLTNTDNVFVLRDNLGNIVDAVLASDAPTGTAANASETAAAIVAAAGQWTNPDGTVPEGGFIDDAFSAAAVLDLDGTGTTVGGTSIQRSDDLDTNSLIGWTMAPSSWGLNNAGQVNF